MDAHTLEILEFDAVRNQLRHYAACSLGVSKIEALQPEIHLRRIQTALQEVAECRRLIDLRGHMPMGGIRDIQPSLEKASVAGILNPSELLELLGTIQGARTLREFLLKPLEQPVPLLLDLAKILPLFPKIEAEINRCITPKAEVDDNATPQLHSIRQRLRVTHNRMIDKLNALLRSPQTRTLLQDAVVTIRDGRYCLPVKSENRREFGGLVHDSSASGATVFMEPQAVVELGNEIRELQLKEEQEVEKILRALALLISGQSAAMLAMVNTLGHLDLVSAKSRWANEHDAVEPELDTTGYLRLYSARHPLLTPPVVPIDIHLGQEFNALILTGPNTGGKTVTLKTVGLLTLMAQAGIPIPAEEGSRIAIFPKMYADIGDEQSIQQSLSTFSSHMRQIIKILGDVDSQTLVLMDELGAGTDPAEGAALAKAILKDMLRKGARILSTTHYGELKEFAFTEPGCKNASVEFDEETLRPTYRLLIGIPGSSNAITIASRLGLPEGIVASAREMFTPERASLESIYRELESDRRLAEQNENAARATREDAERIRQEYLREYQRLQIRKDREAEKASMQAREILKKAREEADAILSDLRSQQRENKITETARQRLNRLANRVERRTRAPEDAVAEKMAVPAAPPDEDEFLEGVPEPGEEVLLSQFGQKGVLLRRENGSSEVQVGAMRLTVSTKSLKRIRSGRKESDRPPLVGSVGRGAAVALERATHIQSELDLRGQRADEALVNLEKYLDDARLAGLPKVRIIHGKGYGALRKIVWDAAKTDPTVRSVVEAPPEEGGAGAAVIDFK